MADAKETVRHLTTAYEIAPAGTREEIDAAEALSRIFHEHGLQTAQKSFNYKHHGNLGLAITMMLLAVASVVGVLVGGVASVVMFVIGLIAAVLYLLDKFVGLKTYANIGLSGSSQNVVARHPAAAPGENGQKARPVVIVAHYDTPRADILSMPQIAWVKPYIPRFIDVAVVVDVVALLCQVLPFPIGLKSFVAALAVIVSVLLFIWGVCTLLHLFVLSYTLGANDNKSGVAALIGVLDRVRPIGGRPFGPDDEVDLEAELAERRARRESEASTAMKPRRPLEDLEVKPRAVRYGAEAIRSLGILPEDCEIEYVPVEVARVHRASDSAAGAAAEAIVGSTMIMNAPKCIQEKLEVEEVAPAQDPVDPEAMKDAEADAMFASIVGMNRLTGSDVEPGSAQTSLLSPVPAVPQVVASSDEADSELRVTGAAPRDLAMQSANVSRQFIMDEPDSFAASAIQDPTWGTSSFRPVSAVPRFLADLPDPAVAAVDPFGVSNIQTVGNYNPEDFSSMDFETGTHQALTPNMLENARRQELSGFTADLQETPKKGRRAKKANQGRISTRARNMQQQMQEQSFNDWLGLDENYDAKTSGAQIGSWDNFAQDDGSQTYGGGNPGAPRWQGGAAPRRTRRATPQSEEAVRARRAAMQLGDRELTTHEVWFVLTGASEAGNAGIKDFIADYRNELKGAYFVNLECLGAGRHSLVIEESASGKSIKADRRLVNIFGEASNAINRPVALERMPWRQSDASAALEQGCRAVTLCGCERAVPVNEMWTGDSPEKLDMIAIDDAVDMVVEVIKRA